MGHVCTYVHMHLWSSTTHYSTSHSMYCTCLGCGKSTLLNSIAGYLPVTKGTITLDGKKMDKSCRSKMSYVFQADLFFEELTLRETLMVSTC